MGFRMLVQLGVLFLVCGYRWTDSASTSGELMDHSEALRSCARSSDLFENSTIREALTQQLEDGSSVWLADYVRFSHAMFIVGCVKKQNATNVNEKTLPGRVNTVYSCANHCITLGSNYTIFNGHKCYCEDFRSDIWSSTKCDYQPSEILKPDFKIHDQYNVAMYIVYGNIKGFRQCVYYTSQDRYRMESCYIPPPMLNKTISFGCHNKVMPYTNETLSWKNSADFCHKLSSSLKFEKCFTVDCWFPFFKPYTIVKQSHSTQSSSKLNSLSTESTACLAISKADGSLNLDPDDCSAKKQSVCAALQSDRRPHQGQPRVNIGTKTDGTTPKQSNTSSPITIDLPWMPTYFIYITSVVASLAVAFAVALCFVCVKQRTANNASNLITESELGRGATRNELRGHRHREELDLNVRSSTRIYWQPNDEHLGHGRNMSDSSDYLLPITSRITVDTGAEDRHYEQLDPSSIGPRSGAYAYIENHI